MNYSFIIRHANIDDAEAVRSIMQEAFKKYMTDAGLAGTMEALEETLEDIRKDIETKDVYIALIDNITCRHHKNAGLSGWDSLYKPFWRPTGLS